MPLELSNTLYRTTDLLIPISLIKHIANNADLILLEIFFYAPPPSNGKIKTKKGPFFFSQRIYCCFSPKAKKP